MDSASGMLERHGSTPVRRSAIRSWVIGERTGNARVIVVKPRDFPAWLASIEADMASVEAVLAQSGIPIDNDETGSSGPGPVADVVEP